MRFWDTSSVVPLIVEEAHSKRVRETLAADGQLVVWWATRVESLSAIARKHREDHLSIDEMDDARNRLASLSSNWIQVDPSDQLRTTAELLVLRYSLRAADALQLAAALAWTVGTPGRHFYCFDDRLRSAARLEGFDVNP